ncbi:toxin-antitoxin system YwqK family antitoxin [Labilibaculum sp.]|uniref:toxin-antitoxin system YwqK family antitoxin n=1 Tax=Labilibaculum sp. TaxID=2060723 RepID=UPI00356334D8
MKISSFLLLLIFLFACEPKSEQLTGYEETERTDGVHKQYDESNRLSSEVTFQNGVKNGVCKIYYSSGELSDEIMYVDDEKHGFAKKFYKNGKLYSLTPYHKGEKDGVQLKYYPNGKLWAETPYRQGQAGIGLQEYKRDGSLRILYPNIEVQKFIKDDFIVLMLSLSNYSKNVIFYLTDLMDDQYIPFRVEAHYSKSGSVRIEIPYTHGLVLDTTLNIVAKYQTQDYNIYVSQRKYQVILNH